MGDNQGSHSPYFKEVLKAQGQRPGKAIRASGRPRVDYCGGRKFQTGWRREYRKDLESL